MDYGVGIAGFSLVLGLLSVIVSVIVVAVVLENLKGPDDRSFSR
jgi:predicted cation transporter